MDLTKILEDHRKWLNNDVDGVRANLSGANLSGVNLFRANLSDANLSGADLFRANLSDNVISISRIGSRNGMTTYNATIDKIWCGCFIGTLEEFGIQVMKTHANNEKFRNQYINAIAFFKSIK